MAHLQKKMFSSAIEDANACLAIQPDYLKAFHRRGKAYQATNKFELAIKDFQYILERSPEDKAINQCLKECRQKLESEKQKQPPASTKEEQPKGFRRVAIAESDSDEENHNTANEAVSAAPKSDSSKPVIEEVSSSEQTNWWQRKENNYSAYEKPITTAGKTEDYDSLKQQIDQLKSEQEKLEQQAQAK